MFLSKDTKKSPYWQLIYFVGKRRTTISTKTTQRNEAETFLENFKQDLLEPKPQQIKSISLSKFRDEYLSYIEGSKSKSYITSVKLSYKMLIQFAGDIKLNHLDLRTLDKFINITYARARRSSSLYYRTLKASFSKAVLWNYLTDNPLKKIKAPKIPKVYPSFITVEELHKILEQTKNDVLKDVFFTAFYTGMRLGELLNMKWNWIDLEKNVITVKCSSSFITKSKKERIIPINPSLKKILINQIPKVINIDKEDFVFRKFANVKLNENYVSKSFKQALRKADIEESIHFHSLRHSFASNLAQKGVSLYVVKELLGHEDLQTTQIYSHLQKENLSQAVNLL